MTPTQVAELLEVLRAHGVRSYKAEGIEIVLEPAAAKGRPHIVTTTYPIAPNSNTETVE